MKEYTYQCELCEKEFIFNKPKDTPYYYPHDCKGKPIKENEVDAGGPLYRVWKPTTVIIK